MSERQVTYGRITEDRSHTERFPREVRDSKAERDQIELEIYKLTVEGGWITAVYEAGPVYHLTKSTVRNWFNNINEDKYYYIGLSHPWTWFFAE